MTQISSSRPRPRLSLPIATTAFFRGRWWTSPLVCGPLLFALALAPLMMAAHPPLFDYPNHLSRAYVLTHWEDVPELHPFFERTSFILPNVLSDLVLIALNQVLPILTAGKVLLAGILAGTMTGVCALHYAAFRRFDVWPLVAAVTVYHEYVLWGFLNYLVGMVIMLWALASWLALRRAPLALRILVSAAFATALFLSHLVAFGLYALALGFLELYRLVRARETSPAAWLRAAIAAAPQFLPPAALFFAVSPSSSLPASIVFDVSPYAKLSPFTRLLAAGNPILDTAVFAALVVMTVLCLKNRLLDVRREFVLLAGFLLLVFAALPFTALQSGFLDARVPVVILAILAAAFAMRSDRPRARAALLALLAGFVVLRSAVLAHDWRVYDESYAEARAAFALLPRGAVLYGAVPGSGENLSGWFGTRFRTPPHEHTVSLATIVSAALVPSIFAKSGQNPLVMTEGAVRYHEIWRDLTYDDPARDLAHLVKEVARIQAGEAQPPPVFMAYFAGCAAWPQGIAATPVWCGSTLGLLKLHVPRT